MKWKVVKGALSKQPRKRPWTKEILRKVSKYGPKSFFSRRNLELFLLYYVIRQFECVLDIGWGITFSPQFDRYTLSRFWDMRPYTMASMVYFHCLSNTYWTEIFVDTPTNNSSSIRPFVVRAWFCCASVYALLSNWKVMY